MNIFVQKINLRTTYKILAKEVYCYFCPLFYKSCQKWKKFVLE